MVQIHPPQPTGADRGANGSRETGGSGCRYPDPPRRLGRYRDPEARTAWVGTGATAGAVTEALSEHGLAVGFGDTEPVASNETEEGRAQNRRIEATEL